MQVVYPLYTDSQLIYPAPDTVQRPLAVVEKIGATAKARLLYNLSTGKEAWFPESVFAYHWHVASAEELVVCLVLPDWLVRKKSEFF